MSDPRRALPAVGTLLDSAPFAPLVAAHARGAVVRAARDGVALARDERLVAPDDPAAWATVVAGLLAEHERPSLRPLFNATGVVLHTNLGRAPLAPAALDAIAHTAGGFCTLEYDVAAGRRGSRHGHCVGLLCELTGAEDALVVNNCAAGLVLALDTLARDHEVAVSRGELVEIGGSFRIPDIMTRGGARLREVGTTNRTHLADYERALDEGAAMLVKVHRSNFALEGYVAEVALEPLARLAEQRGVPLLFDFGSGLLLDLSAHGLADELTAPAAVAAGPTLVVMSGDKLLGGPQAGIVLGRQDVVRRLRASPLARALRVDKLTLAALEATLALYRDPGRALREIPALAMLTAPAAEVRARAESVAARLRTHGVQAEIVASEATVGGGAFPTARIPSSALAFAGEAADVERRLRLGPVPVIGRIADGRALADLRGVPAAHDATFADAIVAALA